MHALPQDGTPRHVPAPSGGRHSVDAPPPLVTVCVPVFNAEAFIADAVDSVLRQTLADFELLVLDNASTDATPAILGRYRDARLHVVRNTTNLGAIGNFNKALSLARGRYTKILCADDVLYPDCLKRQASVLEADTNGTLAMVCCARDIIDARGRRLMRRGYPGTSRRVAGRLAVRQTARGGANLIGEPTAVLFRTAATRAVGEFDGRFRFCVDLDYWCRLLAVGDLHTISEPLCAFRVYDHSWSAALKHSQDGEFSTFLGSLAARPGVALSRLDRALGRTRAFTNSCLRQLFYHYVSARLRT